MLFNFSGWDDSDGGESSNVRGVVEEGDCLEGALLRFEVLSRATGGAIARDTHHPASMRG